MDLTLMQQNALSLKAEMDWLARVIETRMDLYWGRPCTYQQVTEVSPPLLKTEDSVYAQIVNYYRFNFEERIVLLLALAPHLLPHLLDVFFVKNSGYDRVFTEFGGITGQNFNGFLPTGETAAFILAANNLEERFAVIRLFNETHAFRKHNILKLVAIHTDEPFLSRGLQITPEYLSYFTIGTAHQPDFGPGFPAKRISTNLEWDDLVLSDHVKREVEEIQDWVVYGDTLLNDWGMKRTIKPGYRALFYGPPGTGKTLTASLLGKTTGLEVYRIDLSMVVSKFIGETEKNLASVFDQAENKNWILFFDEADALFGKRTQTNSSNDRHANQEVSYLLQRIEDFPGVIILATNLKANIDDAFSRRFQAMIYFAQPDAEQRLKLWQMALSDKAILEDKMDLKDIAGKYELTGGTIINIVRYAALRAIKRGDNILLNKDIIESIRRELAKDGKII
ncbi:AAA+ superfamily predicted ATPase [Pedobacter cryoconitis]|uniref:AAA+ superfamily predicted ATPase n=1 Tax=Pedobacter cryoconitis TaxID=188932 RepID=A0A7W9DZ43_9SPHI|nr:ATP-binding protein [Pedobacter cryoconitis]MBB5636877.1 AAA+ superfamily predicted ATPase [Pedobacter cryoconitis]MBB6271276.1 AAA+ superfamily predicted ATPase [Pedobacter cryoconitis]